MKKKSYIIEFAGLAGSGKTLTKNLLLDKLKADTSNFVFSNNYKVSIRDIINRRSIIILYDSLSFMFNTKQKAPYYFVKGLIYWVKIQLFYSIIREKGGILIIDEGVFQKFRSIRRYSKYNQILMSDIKKKLIKKIYFPDLVVLVKANLEDIIERRKKRDGITLENMKEAINRVNFTKEDIASLYNVKWLEFNNSTKTARLTKDAGINNLVSIIKNDSGFF